MPLGPVQGYLCRYDGTVLPGYVQRESIDSSANIADHYAIFSDGSESEYTGLHNKQLTLTLKVWEPDYLACKNEVSKAATIVRAKKGFRPLYLQYSDRYYDVITPRISIEKTAGQSVRTLEYEVQFEAKPWQTSVSGYSISGTGTIDTDSVGRTIDDGGWTPARLTLSGTNVTVSGYTATGDFTGYISVSGAVTNLIVDSENMTAEIGGINKNNVMRWIDYSMNVGPGKTTFVITGASAATIEWNNRWYL